MGERRGLIEQPDRSPGGHRLYDERAVQTLRTIKAAQRLGFTLDEVADLIEVGRRRGRDSGLQARAREKLVEVEARMADLAAIRDNLPCTGRRGGSTI
ncbi:MerR family DNA-binding protein [Nocardioides sp. NPDC051685]|uniref:MerR family DNA-binding protein n=1 Tax=Nocardioides sp. NPDC051685 TaxID=3364334 RepID=UPI00379D501F